MPEFGHLLSCEEHGPAELVDQARMAEQAGFASLWASDHYHPWNDRQGRSPFAGTVIGALSQAVSLPVETAVACTIMRTHPAVIAQVAATGAARLGDRFRLGVGSGKEALNEHVSAFGQQAAEVAARIGDGLITMMPDPVWSSASVAVAAEPSRRTADSRCAGARIGRRRSAPTATCAPMSNCPGNSRRSCRPRVTSSRRPSRSPRGRRRRRTVRGQQGFFDFHRTKILPQLRLQHCHSTGWAAEAMDQPADTTGVALVVIDMINTYEHEDAELLVPSARRVVPVLAELIGRARSADVPVIYANDNFGLWRSHHGELVDTALARPHADLIEPIRPDDESLFVVKARHSVFYETPLSYLLWRLGVGHVVLSGQVTEQCVLYSALDAHIRHLEVTVLKDAVASIHPHLESAALEMMERNMGARIITAKEIDFARPAADTADRRPGTADRDRARA